MTTSVTDAYSGPFFPNGVTTTFPFDFKAVSADEVFAFLVDSFGNEEKLAPGSFSATLGTDGEGGYVVITPPLPADGRRLWLASDPSFEQDLLFEDEGPFNVAVLNPALDRSAVRDIWLKERVQRSLRLPFGKGGQGELRPIPGAQGVVTLTPAGDVAVLSAAAITGVGPGSGNSFDGGFDGLAGGDSFDGGVDG